MSTDSVIYIQEGKSSLPTQQKCTQFVSDPRHPRRCVNCKHRHRDDRGSSIKGSSTSVDQVLVTSPKAPTRSLIIRKSISNTSSSDLLHHSPDQKTAKLFGLNQLVVNDSINSSAPALILPASQVTQPNQPTTPPKSSGLKKSSIRDRSHRRASGNFLANFSESGSDDHSGSSKTMTIYEDDDSPEANPPPFRDRHHSLGSTPPNTDIVSELLDVEDTPTTSTKNIPLSKRIVVPIVSSKGIHSASSQSDKQIPQKTLSDLPPVPLRNPKVDRSHRRSMVLSSPPGLFAGLGKSMASQNKSEESAIAALSASIQLATPEAICTDILRGSLNILYENAEDIDATLANILLAPSKFRQHGGFLDKSSLHDLSLIAFQINDFITRHKVLRAIVSCQARWRAYRIRSLPRAMISSMAQRNRCAFEILNLEKQHQELLQRFMISFATRVGNKNTIPIEAAEILGHDFPKFVSAHATLVSRLSALLNTAPFGGFFITGIGKLYKSQIFSLFRAFYPEFAQNCAHSENVIRSLSADKRSLSFLQAIEKECGSSFLGLITEITRHVPRLTLHLQGYSSWNTILTEDYADAMEATTAMLDVSSTIEKALSDSVPLSAWLQIRRRLKLPEASIPLTHKQYLDRKRLFIHESILPKISISNPSLLTLLLSNGTAGKTIVQKNIRCILFDDALFFCSLENRSKASLKLNAIVDLDHSTLSKPMKETTSKTKTTAVSVLADSSASTELFLGVHKSNQFLLLPSDDSTNQDVTKYPVNQIIRVTADSTEDAQHWVALIENAIRSRIQTRLFGLPLRTLLDRESSQVPRFITFVTSWLLKNGCSISGLFRVNPNSMVVQNLQSELENRTSYEFLSNYSPHDVGGVFKKFLCSLPSPVIPFNLYSPLIELLKQHSDISAEFAVQLGNLLRSPLYQIPQENYLLLQHLTGFLQGFAAFSHDTQMTDSNLSIVFAPTIMYCFDPTVTGGDHLSNVHFTNDIVLTMIRWHSLCFS